MDGKQKMSQFGSSTLAAMKAAGASVPVFVAGTSNKQIPAGDFAGAEDLSNTQTNLANVAAFVAVEYSENANYMPNNVVWHEGIAYKCNENTSGAWDSTKWTAVTVSTILGMFGSVFNGGSLNDAASINVLNNSISFLSSAQSLLTLNVNCAAEEVPNFAVEISTSAAITLTLTKTVNNVATTLYPSDAGGTALKSGKYYQVTCVDNCWTLAEFTPPSP